jgi:CspA family cold shock protein
MRAKVLVLLHLMMEARICLGKDLFVHHSEIQSGGDYASLNDGQKVEYEVGEGQKGPCANKVVAV